MEQPVVSPVPNSDRYWVLKAALVVAGIVIFKGFITDWASIPRILWAILAPFDGPILVPSLVHDYLYESHEVSRKEADDIFYNLLREAGVNVVTAFLMWSGVRSGGYFAYQSAPQRQKERQAEYARAESEGLRLP